MASIGSIGMELVGMELDCYLNSANKLDNEFNQESFVLLKDQVKQLQQRRNPLSEKNSQKLSLLNAKISELEAVSQVMRSSAPVDEEKKSPLLGRVSFQKTNLYTVTLKNARQYDVKNKQGESPAACTFHAIAAMGRLSSNFNNVFKMITKNETDRLSNFQKDVITDGLAHYEKALLQDRSLVEGADFKQVNPFLQVRLEAPQDTELQPFETRLNFVVNSLLASNGPAIKMAWIKNGNEESFAVIATGKRAIIFDSHKNEIIGTTTQESLHGAIRAKLAPFKNEVDEVDITPFAYALTPSR